MIPKRDHTYCVTSNRCVPLSAKKSVRQAISKSVFMSANLLAGRPPLSGQEFKARIMRAEEPVMAEIHDTITGAKVTDYFTVWSDAL